MNGILYDEEAVEDDDEEREHLKLPTLDGSRDSSRAPIHIHINKHMYICVCIYIYIPST